MPYEILLKKAHSIVDEIPREKIGYVVQLLQSAKGLYSAAPENYCADKRKQERLAALKRLEKYRGRLKINDDFDYKEKLEKALREKHGYIS